jgi:hypothetical protein
VDVVGETCRMHIDFEKCMQNFGPKTSMDRTRCIYRCRWKCNVKIDLG